MARTLPYFEASMARLNLQEPEPIVDKLAPAKEALNTVQKFVNQQEEAKTANVLAKARSDWNIKMNKLQQDTGLDAEGFSDKVGDMLLNEEQRYLEQIPLAQRQKFKEQFSTLKYDFLSKANIYENQALAEKMVVNVRDTINLNANSIISDYTQRDKLTYQTDDMIDRLNLPKSTADALKKESRETYAISEINALTSFSPETLLKNLNSGLYDKDIDPSKKAAAINQAKAKIKSNEAEARTYRNQYINDMYSNDLARVYDTDNPISDVDLMEIKKDYLKVGAVDKWEKLYKANENLKKRNMNLLEARNSYLDGTLVAGSEKSIKTINALAEQDIKNNPDAALSIGRDFVDRTGYLPDVVSASLSRKIKGVDKQAKADAGLYYLDLLKRNPHMKDFFDDDSRNDLITVGLLAEAGYDVNEIDTMIKVRPTKDTISENEELWDKYSSDIMDSCPVDDANIKELFRNHAREMIRRFGDKDLAKKSAINFIERDYKNEYVGSSYKRNIMGGWGFFANPMANWIPGAMYENIVEEHHEERVMYHGPEMEYGNVSGRYYGGISDRHERILAMNKDLLLYTQQFYPEITKEKISLNTNTRLTSNGYAYIVEMNGQPLQNLDESVNSPYLLWIPDYNRTTKLMGR